MRRKVTFTFVLLLPLAAFFLYRFPHSKAQTGAVSSPSPGCCGPGSVEAPRTINFPYYSLRDGFNSTLLLVSDSPKPTDLTIVVRSLSGHALFTHTSIQPGAKLPIDLRSLVASQGVDLMGEFAEGSVSVLNTGDGSNVFKQKLTYVRSWVTGQRQGHASLPDLTGVQYENDALVFYGPYSTELQHYYVPNSAYNGWIPNPNCVDGQGYAAAVRGSVIPN